MQKEIYRKNLLVPFLKMVGDALSVELAMLFSYWLRFYSPLTQLIPVTKGYPPFEGYFYFSLFLILIFLIVFSTFNSYRSRFFPTFSEEIPIVLKTSLIVILMAMAAAFLYRGFSYSRLVFLLIYLNSTVMLLLFRFVFHRLKKVFLRKGYNRLNLLLVGSSELLPNVFRHLQKEIHRNLQVSGYVANRFIPDLPLAQVGDFEDLEQVVQTSDYDGVILAFNRNDRPQLLRLLKASEGKNLELFYVPDILDIFTSHVQTYEVGGIPLLQLKAFTLSGWQGFLKRSFDVAVSALGLLFLSPLFALIAVLIKITSPGPVLYRQERVGMDNQEFQMLKFRTMYVDAESRTGPVWAQKNDPRVTPVGRILRRTSLDELPQLMNVLRGEMSLVGPRPERRYFVEQFRKIVPRYSERHRVRSGMTGWAQVNGLRGQSPIEERTRYDLYYIENWSLWFDIKIIILTILAIIRGENAY